ncbi:MAG: hypothetical protein ACL7AY_09075 [Candidatus Arsenophonus phytopathogenicus]
MTTRYIGLKEMCQLTGKSHTLHFGESGQKRKTFLLYKKVEAVFS